MIKMFSRASKAIKRGAQLGFTTAVAVGASIGAPMTLHYEGMSLKPYYDSVGVLTVCGGETEYVENREYTEEECTKLFGMRYGYYSKVTSSFYNQTAQELLSPEIHAAFTDMSYNVGLSKVKKSSMIRYLNNGQPVKACNAILLYKYAGGHDCSIPGNKICSGIWRRRIEMNELCLKGVGAV